MNLSAFYMAIFASNKLNAHHIDDWDGLGRRNPVLCAFMALTLISLTGLPPTAGFVGKFYIFAEIFKHQQFYWLAVVAILNSVVSLFYYFKIVKSMYLVEGNGAQDKIEAHPVVNWSIILFSAQNILFFIYWEPLIGFIEQSISLWEG
jgi:NADH-quinone oxidoreductase subunit N